jgi:hypothetical protein
MKHIHRKETFYYKKTNTEIKRIQAKQTFYYIGDEVKLSIILFLGRSRPSVACWTRASTRCQCLKLFSFIAGAAANRLELVSGGSTVVEPLTHLPKVEGLSLADAAGIVREKMKKGEH